MKRIGLLFILVALGVTFGTLWVPIGSLLIYFGEHFPCFPKLSAPTFEPNIAKHGPHPPIK